MNDFSTSTLSVCNTKQNYYLPKTNAAYMNCNAFLPNPFLINSEHSWKSLSQLIINKTGESWEGEKSKRVKSRIQKRMYTGNDTLLPSPQITQLRYLNNIWNKGYPQTLLPHSPLLSTTIALYSICVYLFLSLALILCQVLLWGNTC